MPNYAIFGLIGAFLLAIGGALILYSVYQILKISNLHPMGVVFSGFTSFLLVGIGLWLIAMSSKPSSN